MNYSEHYGEILTALGLSITVIAAYKTQLFGLLKSTSSGYKVDNLPEHIDNPRLGADATPYNANEND